MFRHRSALRHRARFVARSKRESPRGLKPAARRRRVIAHGEIATACGLFVALAGSGCREKEEPPRIIPLEGRTVDVNPRKGEITVSFYSDKHDKELTATGLVTDETEIRINGVISTLADVAVGEFVKGEVRVETKGKQKRMVALSIIIDRPEPKPTPPPDGG